MQIPLGGGYYFSVPREWADPYVSDFSNNSPTNGSISQVAREKARRKKQKKKRR